MKKNRIIPRRYTFQQLEMAALHRDALLAVLDLVLKAPYNPTWHKAAKVVSEIVHEEIDASKKQIS